MAHRVLFGVLFHETHTFLRQPTRWEDFTVHRGEQLLELEGDESPAAGFLQSARRFGWEVVPTIAARAVPSGPVEDAAFERYWTEFEHHARPAFAAGVDAVYLVLHGAMATPGCADVEGELLERLRRIPGAAGVPVFGVFDLHANVSARMCRLAHGLVSYRQNPHTDAKAAAERAAGLLQRCLTSGVVPQMTWCRVPVLWAPPGTGTQSDPMRALEAWARSIEDSNPAVWACNVAPGFAFADSPDTALTFSIIADPQAAKVREHLTAGAELAWGLREVGVVKYPSVDAVIEALGSTPEGPVLLVEPADNIGAGAPGDGTGVLRALLAKDVAAGLVAINDPAAVQALAAVPIGGTLRLAIGGRGWEGDAGPVELEVTLLSRRDGRFDLEDLHSHLASMSGARFDMGPCAVVRHRGITLLLTSHKTPPFDLGQYRSQGIEPRAFTFIGVKAAVAHRQAYDPIARASYFVDTPGPCSSDATSFPYQRLTRPLHPLDPAAPPRFAFA